MVGHFLIYSGLIMSRFIMFLNVFHDVLCICIALLSSINMWNLMHIYVCVCVDLTVDVTIVYQM